MPRTYKPKILGTIMADLVALNVRTIRKARRAIDEAIVANAQSGAPLDKLVTIRQQLDEILSTSWSQQATLTASRSKNDDTGKLIIALEESLNELKENRDGASRNADD